MQNGRVKQRGGVTSAAGIFKNDRAVRINQGKSERCYRQHNVLHGFSKPFHICHMCSG